MIEPKISIIVPVYNIAEYLPTCLDSILNQDFRDFELIIINDGSPDHSDVICDHYALKDSRIQVFHQVNKGVSAARNLGLEKARGEWICFIDGDDELYPNSLTTILKEVGIFNYEMIIARSYKNGGNLLKNENYKFDASFLSRTFNGYNLIVGKSYKRGSVCGCIFKRDFLKVNQLKFPLGLTIGEDSIFISLVHLYIKKIYFIDQILYVINEREESASRSWSFEKVLNMKHNIHFVNTYISQHPNLNVKQRHILDFTVYGVISNAFSYLYLCFSFNSYFKLLKAVRFKLNRKLKTGSIPVNKGKVRLLNFSLICFSISVLINKRFRQTFKY
tara:strand:+ start:35089 stop:36084 length:996 start_codon:yes stop_codon:yes gene_type:complete